MESDKLDVTLEHLLRRVPEGTETIFDLLDEGGGQVKTIEVRRRELQRELPLQPNEPPKARAAARNHIFNDIEAFAAYLNREADKDESVVLADVSKRVITAVLNESDPEDRETISLAAIEHPLFTPWAGLLNQAVGVIEFALFVMQHRRAVVDPNGREVALLFSQVKMSKAVQMHVGVGKKSLNGIIADVEIAGEKKGVPVELPETITIRTPLFVGTDPQEIDIDLLVTNRGESVVVYATASDVEEQRIRAFEQMVERLADMTGQLVGLGSVHHRDWKIVR